MTRISDYLPGELVMCQVTGALVRVSRSGGSLESLDGELHEFTRAKAYPLDGPSFKALGFKEVASGVYTYNLISREALRTLVAHYSGRASLHYLDISVELGASVPLTSVQYAHELYRLLKLLQ